MYMYNVSNKIKCNTSIQWGAQGFYKGKTRKLTPPSTKIEEGVIQTTIILSRGWIHPPAQSTYLKTVKQAPWIYYSFSLKVGIAHLDF